MRQNMNLTSNREYVRVSGRSDKVEEGMDTIVAEARVTLDARLFREDIVVLTLNIPCNLSKAAVTVSKRSACRNLRLKLT